MNRMLLLAMASILAGLLLGTAAIIAVTRVAEAGPSVSSSQDVVQESTFTEVSYGDRCIHGHCVPRCVHGYCIP